jgi:hypothetical protein
MNELSDSAWSFEETWLNELPVVVSRKGEKQKAAEEEEKGEQRSNKPDKRDIAPGWDQYVDEESSFPYFYNRATNDSVRSVEETWNSNELTAIVLEEEAPEPDPVHGMKPEVAAETYAESYEMYAQEEAYAQDPITPEDRIFELEGIRARILAKMNHRIENDELWQENGDDSSKNFRDCGITINDRRGEWLMIFDDKTSSTVFYNQNSGQLRQHHPKGWVRLQAKRFSNN